MKKMTIKNGLIAGMAVFSLTLAVPVAVYAETTSSEDTTTTVQSKRELAQANAADKKEAAQTRLAATKLKVCQNREKAITNIMTRMGDRGQKQVDLFTKIADRTKTFYADKGKTVSNYDALVADVDAKKADAQTAVDATKATVVEFKCDGTDPKGAAASFKESLKTQTAALKAYKTSVKNLIVGVKSVQGSTTSTENSQTGGDQ